MRPRSKRPATVGQPVAADGAVELPRVRRSSRWAELVAVSLVLVVVALGLTPLVMGLSTINDLTQLFILMVMGIMWNLLAGYAGLVSIGLQAFVGLGGYSLLDLADHHGVEPFAALALAALLCGAASLATSFVTFRLTGGYFAIGTWVIAEVFSLVTLQITSLGGGSGAALESLSSFGPANRLKDTYWAALVCAVVAFAGVYLLMRTRTGLSLTACRDDEEGARSLGVRSRWAKRIAYTVAGIGCGAAGGLLLLSNLDIVPSSAYSVNLSAYMIFIVLIGGIGTIEGPVIGAVVFWIIQLEFASYGAWYLIALGVLAVLMTLVLSGGLAGLTRSVTHLDPFPIGYKLSPKVAADQASSALTAAGSSGAPGDPAESD
jgi:branched-chain amino acid transport system permease protein